MIYTQIDLHVYKYARRQVYVVVYTPHAHGQSVKALVWVVATQPTRPLERKCGKDEAEKLWSYEAMKLWSREAIYTSEKVCSFVTPGVSQSGI